MAGIRTSLIVASVLSITVALSGCVTNRSFGGGVDDISSDITLKTRLLNDDKYNYNNVDIVVFEGRMMLTGTMSSEAGISRAGDLAGRSDKTYEVINELIVGQKTSFRQGTSDAFIDEKLGLVLRADDSVIRNNFQFAVSEGVIYILGVAQNPSELNRVTEHARHIRGVKKVVSHVLFVGDPKRKKRA